MFEKLLRICLKLGSGTKMQPKYEKPTLHTPAFSKPGAPCYDYRNMEKAGQYRGVGERGKTGHFNSAKSMDAMPTKKISAKVRRDHEG